MLSSEEETENRRFTPMIDPRPDDGAWPHLNWPPESSTRLVGTAVELTPLDPDRDAAELFPVLDHDKVWQHVAGRPQNIEECVAGLKKRHANGMFGWLVRLTRPLAGLDAGTPQAGMGAGTPLAGQPAGLVTRLEAGTVVGTSSYLEVSADDARLEIGATMYAPAVWASAVNPDTKLQLLGYAFESLGAGRVQLKTDIRNVRSQQAIARLGAQYEGTLRRHKRRTDGSVRDSVLFSITAEEWPAVRERLLGRVTR